MGNKAIFNAMRPDSGTDLPALFDSTLQEFNIDFFHFLSPRSRIILGEFGYTRLTQGSPEQTAEFYALVGDEWGDVGLYTANDLYFFYGPEGDTLLLPPMMEPGLYYFSLFCEEAFPVEPGEYFGLHVRSGGETDPWPYLQIVP